jgi:hypothetical protein
LILGPFVPEVRERSELSSFWLARTLVSPIIMHSRSDPDTPESGLLKKTTLLTGTFRNDGSVATSFDIYDRATGHLSFE